MSMPEITLNAEGAHLLDARLSFLRRDAESYVTASRIADARIAAAVIAPGKMKGIDINDLHVSLTFSHADLLRVTARQIGVKMVGDLVSFSGCSAAKGRRMSVPWTTGCRSTRPLERLFVDLYGNRPTSAVGAQYLMMIVDSFLQMGWPYVVTMKSDVLNFNASGVPSTVECIRSDNGTEFVRVELVKLLDRRGLRRDYIPVGSPKRNDVVERYIVMTIDLVMASCLEPALLFGSRRRGLSRLRRVTRLRRTEHDGEG